MEKQHRIISLFLESLGSECKEIQQTAYGEKRPVFGIASVPYTDFGNTTSNKFNIWSHWVESVWKCNTQHIAKLDQFFGLHKSQILVSIWDSINPKY